MEKGVIFDVQRGSFVDGPGIRTTVFFKGCNLRCQWCHNPESWRSEKELLYYQNKCTGCHQCVKACPQNAVKPAGPRVITDRSRCTACGRCTEGCLAAARSICGREYAADEVVSIVLQDADFYRSSGGGVTFSGGECLLQIDFLDRLCRLCKKHHIHVAIDTAGNVDWNHFVRILPYADVFLYDIKTMDEAKHRSMTGVSNRLILQNIQKLNESGKDIIVRIPLIGGFNDTEADISAIAEFVTAFSQVKRVELLPFHPMGQNKALALGYPPASSAFKVDADETTHFTALINRIFIK
ncbi:MAG: glycyl-radical enzyme activating protein [Lentisphaeria bacterium]